MKKLNLNGKWRLSFNDPETGERYLIPCEVPGNVEDDMKNAGIIDDYWPADDIESMRKWDFVDKWTYETSFSVNKEDIKKEINLVFEGIDTVSSVFLNGKEILNTKNMHRTYRISVGDVLEEENILRVEIMGAEAYARTISYDCFYFPHGFNYVSQAYLRKARHAWGWDNAPRILTCGIWRSVYLEEIPEEYFSDVYIRTKSIDEHCAWVYVNWQYETDCGYLLGRKGEIEFSLNGEREFYYEFDASFTRGITACWMDINRLKLWYPRGAGESPVYDVTLRVKDLSGEYTGAEWHGTFGVRTVKLECSDVIIEKDGKTEGKFCFTVNGKPIFIRGTNWKPTHALASQCEKRNQRALEMARDLNCNMIRIWGGGIYESEEFFDFCDRNGILVWQDFMIACEWNPRDEGLQEEIKAEAVQVIKQYRNHPSLAVWCGDNECDEFCPPEMYPSENVISRRLLRELVLKYDPSRDYVASSPYRDDRFIEQTRKGKKEGGPIYHLPEVHLYPDTCVFGRELRRSKSPFTGETGPFFVSSITDNPDIFDREKARAERLWNDTIPWYNLAFHQTDSFFVTWRDKGRSVCNTKFGRDFSFEEFSDYTLAINYVCSDLFKDVIEYSRSRFPEKTGVIWWSLCDMWPMLFNYSVIDYDYRPKMAYHWIKNSQQTLCLALIYDEEYKKAELFALNDSGKKLSGHYTVEDEYGKTVMEGDFTAASELPTKLGELYDGASGLFFIKWSSCLGDGKNHFFAYHDVMDFDTVKSQLAKLSDIYCLEADLGE